MLPTGSVIVRVTLAAVGVVTLGGVYIAVLPLLAIVPSEAERAVSGRIHISRSAN